MIVNIAVAQSFENQMFSNDPIIKSALIPVYNPLEISFYNS